MVQHPNPKKVLLVSGGVSGTLNEILKYDIASVKYLELNQEMIRLGNLFTNQLPDDERIQILNLDARIYLRKTDEKFDVVILDLPEPSNLQLNRFYTIEFFELVRQRMTDQSVISLSLPPVSNYLSEEALELNASMFSTLKLIFQNVVVIPGSRNFFISSNSPVKTEIAEMIQRKQIDNEYVNQYFIDDYLTGLRSKKIVDQISEKVLINYDFKPVTHLLLLKLWLSYFDQNMLFYFIFLAIPLVLVFFNLNTINLGLFSTGFTAASLEIILIVAFQVIYGFVYQMAGIMITSFMAGLALGSLRIYKYLKLNKVNYSLIQYFMGLFAIFIAVILLTIKSMISSEIAINAVFIALIFTTGILTGMQFSFATKLMLSGISQTASKAYSTDLIGSALGALLVSVILIPQFGILRVCLLVGTLNFLVGLTILIRLKFH
jgi:spermidine synthase